MHHKKPSDVFTPRAAQVNESMYVARATLEERLIDSLDSNKYIVIHGESGNGKTWLYKRVFIEREIHYDVVNLAQVTVSGSLEAAFAQKLGELGYSEKTKVETTAIGGARPMNVGIEYHSKTFDEYAKKSPFHTLLSFVRDRARGAKPVLVLDNFESIVRDDKALQQLAGLIISADDEAVARYGVQVVIVGVPGNLKEIITKLTNSAPVANRLTELPEVARMSDMEARDLITRGFTHELKLDISPEFRNTLFDTIIWTTDRIAQHIHELCLIIANNAVRNGRSIDQATLDKSLATWVDDSLSSDMAVIEVAMNAIETKAGRKNQVLYAMGDCRTENFKAGDIEAIVRDHFDVGSAKLNVSQILAGFAAEANPIIRRTPKGDAWRFVSPKLKMAIRSKLQKDDGKVTLRE